MDNEGEKMNPMKALRYMPKKDDVLMEPSTGCYATVDEDVEKNTHVRLIWSDQRTAENIKTPIARIRSSLITESLILVRKEDEDR
jgi:hypothetical protein